MIRTAFGLPLLLLGAVAATPVAAQDLLVYLQAGWALPTDPPEFSELWNTASSFGGGLGVRLSEKWELVGSLHVQSFPADEAGHIDGLLLLSPEGQPFEIRSVEGRDATVTTLLGELRYHFGTRIPRTSPFFGFGVGYLDMTLSAATLMPDADGATPVKFPEEVTSGLATSVGAGFSIRISRRLRFVLDSIYTIGFTEGLSTQFLPLRIGVAIG
jgi:hypothetical protein